MRVSLFLCAFLFFSQIAYSDTWTLYHEHCSDIMEHQFQKETGNCGHAHGSDRLNIDAVVLGHGNLDPVDSDKCGRDGTSGKEFDFHSHEVPHTHTGESCNDTSVEPEKPQFDSHFGSHNHSHGIEHYHDDVRHPHNFEHSHGFEHSHRYGELYYSTSEHWSNHIGKPAVHSNPTPLDTDISDGRIEHVEESNSPPPPSPDSEPIPPSQESEDEMTTPVVVVEPEPEIEKVYIERPSSSNTVNPDNPTRTRTRKPQIVEEVEIETPPDVDEMTTPVVVIEPEPEIEKVYTEFQFYNGFNIFAPSVMLDDIITVKDFWDKYTFLEILNAIIYVHVEDLWYSYDSNGGMAGDVPLNPYMGMIIYLEKYSLLGMHGIPYPKPQSVNIPIGISVMAFPMFPTGIQRPSDFIELGVDITIVSVKGELKLVGRVDDEGDVPFIENQGVIIITQNQIVIDFPEVPQAPQAYRIGTLTITWGEIKSIN